MRISRVMPLQALLDLMGSEAKETEALELRGILLESGRRDTRDIPEEEWRRMLDDANARYVDGLIDDEQNLREDWSSRRYRNR